MVSAPATRASSRYLLSFASRQSVTRTTGSNHTAARSGEFPRSAGVVEALSPANFGRENLGDLSASAQRKARTRRLLRRATAPRSGTLSALSATLTRAEA